MPSYTRDTKFICTILILTRNYFNKFKLFKGVKLFILMLSHSALTYFIRQLVLVLLWLNCQAVKAPDLVCQNSAGSGFSWAAERSWHAPLSLGLRRLRLRRRQGWWWMGCRPCLPASFDKAAVICYKATVASINFWHMHTCTLSTTDLPLLSPSHLFWVQGKWKRQSEI